ncbi:MAG: sigma-70 family RNA polymerase sigma factor [Bacteroidetes bacterium]|nr:MAG: sigma-70 family RNA polymerase sigma factor [Bacteroidota bacterium]
MEKEKNEQELQWLHHQPERLIEAYQPVIEIIVSSFFKKGFFNSKDKMDLVQEINLQLLESKIEKIKAHFNNSVKLRTYFSKVVYNTCLEIARKNPPKSPDDPGNILSNTPDNYRNPMQELALKEETLRLHGCLLALPKSRLKATLCLKAIAKIPFDQQDIQFLQSPKTEPEILSIKENLFANYSHLQLKEVFGLIADLYKKIEGKSTEGDSLRKWTNQLLDRFIYIMNGNPPHAAYSRETMKTLLQYYFAEYG